MGGVVEKLAFPVPQSIEMPEELQKVECGSPVPFTYAAGSARSAQVEFVWLLNTYKQKFPALWYKVPEPRYTVIYSHGNAEDITNYAIQKTMAAYAKKHSVNVFSYEYSGYSWSCEKEDSVIRPMPGEKYCYANINRAYEFLTTEQNIPPSKIIVFGKSLGTGVTVDFASRHREIKAVILQSPLTSAIRVVMPFSIIGADIFTSIDKIEKIKPPTLIIHGRMDEVVPFEHGVKLESMLKCPLKDHMWIDSAGHNNIESEHWDQLNEKIAAFLNSIESYQALEPKTPSPPSTFKSFFSASSASTLQ
eukprot:TRINITY_DN1650_c0_g3_i1.p1 TRINITY_DN1650_c0_g3~~TRINITY_DN1650_c0_g3_i1.p1  ORF type:complete len:305 (+),score=37.10 TRINITY_DN1650_c0_g3_i1:33-947(+)